MKRIVTRHAIDHRPCADDFALVDAAIPACEESGVLLRVLYLSLDPYIGSVLRGRHMGHAAPAPMVEAPGAAVVGEVIETRSDLLAKGDFVLCRKGLWQEIIAVPAAGLEKIDRKAAPLSAYAGVLGSPGLTAWASARHLARIRDGDTVLVDAAAGPVGGTFGQLARAYGARRVVGVAGGPEKCALVTGVYGFDACIDYKAEGWEAGLRAAVPDGIDVFHENVSTQMAATALSLANDYVRGVLCGLAGVYHASERIPQTIDAGMVIFRRAQISGLIVYDFEPRWREFVAEVAPLIASQQVRFVEDRAVGLENAPQLFEKLMNGENIGKSVVVVAAEQEL
jgi:NADPH-dependent curcumin reductase